MVASRSWAGGLLASLFLQAGAVLAAPDCQPIRFLDDPAVDVPASGEYHYLVRFQNNTADDASAPRLTVSVPNGFTFNSADDGHCGYSGATPSGGDPGDEVVCDWPTLPGNTFYDVDITLHAGTTTGTYTGTATAICSSDANPANDSENNQVNVVASADLLLSKSSTPNPIPAGGIVTYAFSVHNNGPHAAVSSRVSDALPTGLVFVADDADPSADDDGDWTCSAAGQDVTCNGPSISVGDDSVFHFRARVTSDVLSFT